MDAIIELKGIVNRFGAQVVHDHLDLSINKNEILGLVGGSGSGKSVLLRTILGLNKPQEGQVLVDGEDVYDLDAEARLRLQQKWGVLFQSGALFSGLSVLDNIALPLREHSGLPEESIQQLAYQKLAMVGLPREAGAKVPSQLSGGMIKRAALARAMAMDPAILFLDEPTAGLDPIAAASFDKLIRTLQKVLGISILIITHDLDSLVGICDRIAMLVDKKAAVGTLDDLMKMDHPFIKEYFGGERMRAALGTQGAKNHG